MNAPARRAVVIGAGIAGLATAALLARDGYDVEVLEQRDEVGGRAGTWRVDGFTFDTGPSWYLMPEVFDHFFALFGTSAQAELDLVTLDPAYRVFFDDEAPLDLSTGRAPAQFEAIEPGAGARLEEYLESAREAYDLSLQEFLYTTFSSPGRLATGSVVRKAPRLARLLTTSLEKHVARRFTDRRLRQVLGYPAVFLGTSPERAPSLYHLMSHCDLTDGVRYPMGGFGTLIDAIRRVAEGAGVRVRTGVRVTGVEVDDARAVRGVTCVATDGAASTVAADVVVGAGDLHDLETNLLPAHLQTYPERWWRSRDPGPGAVLVYLGIRGHLPQLAHHSLFFSADWHANFDAVFGTDRHVPTDASMYVCTPSRTDPSVAPADMENVFVLVPVPADVSIGTGGVDGAGDDLVERAADAAIARIAQWAGVPDLAERVVVRRTVGPADFAREYSSWSGGALGPAHTLRQSAMLRGRNASTKISGLLYAGGSTLPGIGLPMCLISAENVVKRLRDDRSSGPLPEPARSGAR